LNKNLLALQLPYVLRYSAIYIPFLSSIIIKTDEGITIYPSDKLKMSKLKFAYYGSLTCICMYMVLTF